MLYNGVRNSRVIEVRNKVKCCSILLIGLLLILGSLVAACRVAPPTTSTPIPEVTLASLTETTMASKVDSFGAPIKTASIFTDDISAIHCCAKLSNAPANTRINAEWRYVGGVHSDLLDCILYENSLIKSGTCRINFSQNRPSSGWPLGRWEVVLYLNGAKSEIVPFTIVETPPPPPEPETKELFVMWVEGVYSGTTGYHIEGSVRNTGTVPLHDIRIEVSLYDSDGTLIRTEGDALYPSPITVGEVAHFRLEFQQVRGLETYSYRFVSSSGESINFEIGY